MFKLKPQEPPPPDYYAANLRRLFGHVQRFYGDILSAEEAGYLVSFLDASSEAQRLYARLVSRKGPWIRADKLAYREINELDDAIAALQARGLIHVNEPAPADALLGLLTQAERQAAFPGIAPARKAQWILHCVSRYQDQRVRGILAQRYRWVSLSRLPLLRLVQLLFFGDDRQDTSTFVLQDLGLMRFEPYELTVEQRLFADRSALERYRRLRALNALSHRLKEHGALADWLSQALTLPACSRQEQRQRDRTLNRLGQHHERAGCFEPALECYGRSRMHPSRERRARMLNRLGDRLGAERLVAKMAAAPRCAEEVDFAERFGRGQRRNARAGPEVFEVPLAGMPAGRMPAGGIEAHAASLLSAGGAAVFHLENALPRMLAGLAYWEVIFQRQPGAFTNPFQAGPLDLFWPDFAATRAAAIARRSAELSQPGAFKQALQRTFAEKAGVANRLVSWRQVDGQVVPFLLRHVPERALLDLAAHVIRRPYRTRTGFPDLTVIYGPGNFEFVEVKGPSDQLQPAQRVWLRALAEMGIRARVMKFKAC